MPRRRPAVRLRGSIELFRPARRRFRLPRAVPRGGAAAERHRGIRARERLPQGATAGSARAAGARRQRAARAIGHRGPRLRRGLGAPDAARSVRVEPAAHRSRPAGRALVAGGAHMGARTSPRRSPPTSTNRSPSPNRRSSSRATTMRRDCRDGSSASWRSSTSRFGCSICPPREHLFGVALERSAGQPPTHRRQPADDGAAPDAVADAAAGAMGAGDRSPRRAASRRSTAARPWWARIR